MELTGALTTGETVVDLWNYKRCGTETWDKESLNCLVTEGLEVCSVLIASGWLSRVEDRGGMSLKDTD